MNIEVNDKGIIELREVFSGISLITRDGEKIHISMRDSGFEFHYQGKYYEAKEGEVKVMDSKGNFSSADTSTTLPHKN